MSENKVFSLVVLKDGRLVSYKITSSYCRPNSLNSQYFRHLSPEQCEVREATHSSFEAAEKWVGSFELHPLYALEEKRKQGWRVSLHRLAMTDYYAGVETPAGSIFGPIRESLDLAAEDGLRMGAAWEAGLSQEAFDAQRAEVIQHINGLADSLIRWPALAAEAERIRKVATFLAEGEADRIPKRFLDEKELPQ
jgi:hypothetical protein